MTKKEKVFVGMITGPHGVKGLVKVRSFTITPTDIFSYGDLYDETLTRTFSFKNLSLNKNVLLCEMEGVHDRETAEQFKGTKLFALREGLPKIEEEDEFYHTDLIGLKVTDGKDKDLGTVSSVFNFGAGDILDITTPSGKSVMIPFTKKDIPVVDVDGGFIKVASTDWFKAANRSSMTKEENNV